MPPGIAGSGTPPSRSWPRQWWQAQEAWHQARVGPLAEAFVARRGRGEKHPVWDFLFTYYTFSPAKLLTWVPGLQDAPPVEPGDAYEYEYTWPTPRSRDRQQAQWVATLCEQITHRAARFGCFGLHEWAMVYRATAEEVRHQQYPLRLSPEALATFVQSQSIACTHYDAYRFFTPAARPLNLLNPTLESRLDMEQGGCLHANMDLYKWAYKLWPWVGSELVAEAFLLAADVRVLDMRASPYDLAHLGFPPIPIETPAGREEYIQHQQKLADRAKPIRARLRLAAEVIAHAALPSPSASH